MTTRTTKIRPKKHQMGFQLWSGVCFITLYSEILTVENKLFGSVVFLRCGRYLEVLGC